MIVLNGEPFTRYNLRSIYPWAHQIIVVEGACKAASRVADPQGHSKDGTLDELRRFQSEEDPEKKLTLVTAEDEGHPNGFWPGEKDEMSQAYAKRATGNYLWQVDGDEFYLEEDMPAIISLLQNGVNQVSFHMFQFWGGIGFVENGEYLSVMFQEIHRVFAWENGYRYVTHRPPTVVDAHGADLRTGHWEDGSAMRARNIFLYHYSVLLPKQVREKCSYYSRVDWAALGGMEQWANEIYFQLKNPFKVTSRPFGTQNWLEEYHGSHPKQVQIMIENIKAGLHPGIELRPTEDIARVLRSPSYRFGRLLRKLWVSMIPTLNLGRHFVMCIAKTTPFATSLRRWHRCRIALRRERVWGLKTQLPRSGDSISRKSDRLV